MLLSHLPICQAPKAENQGSKVMASADHIKSSFKPNCTGSIASFPGISWEGMPVRLQQFNMCVFFCFSHNQDQYSAFKC